MKCKMFYAWLMIALFAVVSFGGCGGSPSNNFVSQEEPETQSSVSMQEALYSDDIAQKIIDRVISNDEILAGLALVKIYQLSVSGDGQIWMEDGSLLVESSDPVLYDLDELRRHYDSEDVILLAGADIDFINKIRADLGETSEDPSIVGASGYLDIYVMNRIISGNSFQRSTYSVPTIDDIISSEGMSSQQDSSQPAADILSSDELISNEGEEVYTAVDFVVERWVNLLDWMSQFGIRRLLMYLLENGLLSEDVISSAAFSAAEALTDEADIQNHTFDFSYSGIPAEGITYDDWDKSATAFTISRTNELKLQVYSAHSFQTGNDYYFVKSTASTTPKNYKSTKVSPMGGTFTSPYLYGYTKYLGFEAWLDGSTANNVTLAAANPGTLQGSPNYYEAKRSATTSHNIDSWTGVHQYSAPYAVNGASYSNTQTWITYGWDMVNNSGANHPSSAGWYADVYLPASMWGTMIPSGGATGKLSYTTDWVWEVKPDFWKSHKTVKMNVDFDVQDGATISSFTHAGTKHDRADKWFSNKRTASLTLTPPPHVAAKLVGKSLSTPLNSMPLFLYNLFAGSKAVPFSYTLDKKADTLTLKVLAEEPWTLTYETSDGKNWVKFSETSGSATGAAGKDITLTFEENKSSSRTLQIDIQSGQDHAAVNILQ